MGKLLIWGALCCDSEHELISQCCWNGFQRLQYGVSLE